MISLNKIYRLGVFHQRGDGNNAIIRAYLAVKGEKFTTFFAEKTTGTWQTPLEYVGIGATSNNPVSLIVDHIAVSRSFIADEIP